MKSITEYIIEKLKINKDFKVISDRITNIDELKNINTGNLKDICQWNLRPGELNKHMDKMIEYQKKGSKPERLVNSIKDKKKLIIRWRVTIDLKWKEAFIVFRDAIVDRGYFNINELHAYFIEKYKGNDYSDWIEEC